MTNNFIKTSVVFVFLVFSNLAFAQVDSIIFIGNSYTYANNLPNLFDELTKASGDTFYVQSISKGGYLIQSHVNDPAHLAIIQSTNWDYAIVQEQSQVPTIDHYYNTVTLPAAVSLETYVSQNNPCAKTFFFMTWGRRYGGQQCDQSGTYCSVNFSDFNHMQDTLRSRYLKLAEQVDGSVSPVGEAWRLALRDTTGLILHTSDNSHPNLYGSYLAACTHYASITGKSPVGNSFSSTLSSTWANYLQRKAAEAVLDSFLVYGIDTTQNKSLSVQANAEVNNQAISCEIDSLTGLFLISQIGQVNGPKDFVFSLNTFDQNGNQLVADSLKVSVNSSCSIKTKSQSFSIPIDSNFHTLIVKNLQPQDSSVITMVDTLASFTPSPTLIDSNDFYVENFTTKPYTASYDLWTAEQDLLNGTGWNLEGDASTYLAQPAQLTKGAAIVTLNNGTSPKWLKSPCIFLAKGIYEIEFEHTNHQFDTQTGIAFRLALDSTEGFTQPNVLNDFGKHYDSTFTTFKDTFEITKKGFYYLGIEAYAMMNASLVGKMGIDNFKLRTISLEVDTNTSIFLDESSEKEIKVFPNPAVNFLNISLSNEVLNPFNIELFNAYGVRLSFPQIPNGNKIDVSQLKPGLYYLRAYNAALQTNVKPVIILGNHPN